MNFKKLIGDALLSSSKDLNDIVLTLRGALRAAKKSSRRLEAHDLLSARKWANLACDLEYRALGHCDGYAAVTEFLEDDIESCPYRSRYCSGSLIICAATCDCAECQWRPGDKVRSYTGTGVVVTSDGEAEIVWDGPVLTHGQYVWRVWRAGQDDDDDDCQHP